MKKAFTLFGLLLVFGIAFGKKINENTAKNAGQSFLTNSIGENQRLKKAIDLQLVYSAKSSMIDPKASTEPEALFYVFNTGNEGFVIVAGDDQVTPILGYSTTGTFDPENMPQNVAKWLQGYKSEIRYIIENDIQASVDIVDKWKNLNQGGNELGSASSTTSVNPLMKTQWNQSPYYNSDCPGGSVTGCVATAMAQIMKYWNYPAKGSGFHSYNHPNYGTLSATFSNSTYAWNSMTNTLSGPNPAIAKLMWDVGVSVDMDYSPSSSGAYVISAQSPVENCSEFALKTYFGYRNTLSGVQRVNYDQAQWITLLKTELNAGRPVLYAGFGTGGGHCFVTDGYDANSYFHFNWGWGGAYDGFFEINALNPAGLGTGGGSGGYNSGHQAVIGIQPPAGNQTYTMMLYNYVMPSLSTISYGQGFTVTTNIQNAGTATFTGDYCAAVFDSENNFVDYVQILENYSLAGGYVYNDNLVFSTTGLFGMLPGTYKVYVYARPAGGNWNYILDYGNYTNNSTITVVNSNKIELYSAMTVSPGKVLTQGEPASINLNVINNGSTTFKGWYNVSLFNLDGTAAQSINDITESNGLPSGYVYVSPFLNFSTDAITVSPGTYLLAVLHYPENGSWELTGSTNFQNPIMVTVKAPSIPVDPYEPNNSVGQSYNLAPSFTGNTSTSKTSGATCHLTSDTDYYKFDLPSGYNYTIKPRLHDSYSSTDGTVYTLDGLFSYSLDGIKWSGAYDDVMSGNFTLKGGGVLYIHVAPYFAGEMGTYSLEVNITRASSAGVENEVMDDLISVYPNPASDIVTVDLSRFQGRINRINLLNINGQQVDSEIIREMEQTKKWSVAELTDGIYFFQFISNEGVMTKKITVSK